MVNEEKVKIMTAIAHKEKKYGNKIQDSAFYYKNDYVKKNVLFVLWNYTVGFCLVLILIALYNIDYLLLNFVKINYVYIGIALLFSYLLILIVSGFISKIFYQEKYDNEQKMFEKYRNDVIRLKKYYAEDGKETDDVNIIGN